MDHLPSPIHALTHPAIQIPYVCASPFLYDDRGFLTYPYRMGIDWEDLCDKDVICSASLVPFLQAWLWFGLLGETIGIGSRSHIPQKIASCDSFTRTLPNGAKILTTATLKDAVLRRRETITSSSIVDSLRTRYDFGLIRATQAINDIFETPSFARQIEQAQSLNDLDSIHLIVLSAQMLIESLLAYRSFLFSLRFPSNVPNPPDVQLRPDLLNIMLQDAGYCPFQIKRMEVNLLVKFFLSSTIKYNQHKTADCTAESCAKMVGNNHKMHPRHANDNCVCDSIDISDVLVQTSAQNELVPVLKFDEVSGGTRELHVREIPLHHQNTHFPFVAFSHVRNQGLGNTANHSLPYCQLSLLQVIANDTFSTGPKSGPVPFYIDTVCLPLKSEQKKKAIRHLSTVFEEAAAVVVLDSSLTTAVVGSEIDCILRIRYSDWKARLWTLQEGSLAKKLLFRFANGTVDLDEMLAKFEENANLSILSRAWEISNSPRPDNEFVHIRLRAFDHDLKLLPDHSIVAGPGAKAKFRVVLRLGYLGLPRYRYFREKNERIQSYFVLQALEEVYGNIADLQYHNLELVQERLEQMYALTKHVI